MRMISMVLSVFLICGGEEYRVYCVHDCVGIQILFSSADGILGNKHS